jgi:murein DD-endopeptidase MepM/ murein hydrolase activator NlpD
MRAALVVAISLSACADRSPERASPTPRATVAPRSAAPSAEPTPTPTPARTRRPATRAPSFACTYAFPVEPPSSTSYARAHHDYPATDIFAPRGSRFVAPTAGVVDFVTRTDEWDPKTDDPSLRGGRSVAIVGDDGVRYYGSHLLDVASGIAPGHRVDAGDLLGHVDSSGNARGIDPHLHFGISHPTTADDWKVRRGEVSPYDVLNAWKSGDNARPSVPGARAPSCTPP